MENYVLGEIREVEEELCPFQGLENSVVSMRVNASSRIRNIMGYAFKKMKEVEVKQIMWNGSGHAINKTISCAEIMKRKIKGLHQVTKIRTQRIEEYWEPKLEGLERLKVNRDIPVISILLSKEVLDNTQPGYQAPGSKTPSWFDHPYEEKRQTGKPPKTGSIHQNRKRKQKSEKSDTVKNKEKNIDISDKV